MTDPELDRLIEIAMMLEADDDWTEAFSQFEELFVTSGELVRVLKELREWRHGERTR